MTHLKIQNRNGLYLSPITIEDKLALLEHLRTKDVYNTTLNIPYPYVPADADWWIRKRVEHARRQEREITLALREQGKLIGVVGADSLELGMSHRAEIGYWIARQYWGQGIMTDAVRTYVRYAFAELGVTRLTAHVFDFNSASARVLEKNGFVLEGTLRKHFLKDGRLIDAMLYGLLKDES